MKKYLILLLLTSFTILSGCASLYQPPKKNEPAAFVKLKDSRSGLATWTALQVQSIDNKPSGLQLLPTRSLRIYPGVHTLTVQAQFNQGFFSGGPFESFTDLTANFKAGETYFVEAAVQGSKVLAWISNTAGKKITPVAAESYRTAPKQGGVIIIPTRR